jgi:hypothetical protein
MTTTYTLIAYKPNGSDCCRGCVMSRWNSDFELCTFEYIVDLENELFRFHKLTDETEGSYELTILVNGIEESYLRDEELITDIDFCRSKAYKRYLLWVEESKKEQLRKNAETQLKKEQSKLAAERAEYEKLKAKFGEKT